jgi:hypothetical protein
MWLTGLESVSYPYDYFTVKGKGGQTSLASAYAQAQPHLFNPLCLALPLYFISEV